MNQTMYELEAGHRPLEPNEVWEEDLTTETLHRVAAIERMVEANSAIGAELLGFNDVLDRGMVLTDRGLTTVTRFTQDLLGVLIPKFIWEAMRDIDQEAILSHYKIKVI